MKNRRHDATGRSSGRFIPKVAAAMQVDRPFVQLSQTMLASPAWRGLGINARRFIDFLICEHLAHGAQENGRLVAPYGQLEARGCLSRNFITAAIDEAETAGFVRRTSPQVMRVAMTYRLTFLASAEAGAWSPPSNEWRRIAEVAESAEEDQKSTRHSGGSLPAIQGADRGGHTKTKRQKPRKSANAA